MRLPALVSFVCLATSAAAQLPPAPVPTVFAPGVISGPADDADPAFSADGRTVVFARNGTLMISHLRGSAWSAPVIAPFSGQWMDQQPTMSPDGRFLVFVSNRPVRAGDDKRPAGHLWRVDRHGDGWGQPVHLPATVNRTASTWAPSVAGDGSLYFIEKRAPDAPFRLRRAQYRDGDYLPSTPVDFGDPTTQDVDPAVAPDESFIVFGSMHPGPDAHERLFIALRDGDHWGKPVDLGDAVNADGATDTNEARLGPDHRTLYFSTDRMSRPHYPRTPAQALADQARTAAWDNGRQNIWSVPLDAWLRDRSGATPSRGAAGTP
jgi:dipeptidyl aminopeptidase/acylaminoacyl peptidase